MLRGVIIAMRLLGCLALLLGLVRTSVVRGQNALDPIQGLEGGVWTTTFLLSQSSMTAAGRPCMPAATPCRARGPGGTGSDWPR